MAAGLVVLGQAGRNAVRRTTRLAVFVNGEEVESALVDVVLSSMPFVGSRAICDLTTVSEVVLSRVAHATIDMSALGGALLDGASNAGEQPGMHIRLGAGGSQVLVALAPGLIDWVDVSEYRRLALHDVVRFPPGNGNSCARWRARNRTFSKVGSGLIFKWMIDREEGRVSVTRSQRVFLTPPS